MKRQKLIDEIAEMLATLSSKVQLLNSVNLTDLSVHAEDFYCELVNAIYGYSLRNLNADERNTAAIDLGDTEKRIALQVTADGSSTKLRETLDKFIERGMSRDFDRLVVLQISGDARHKEGKVGDEGQFQLDKKEDVWDNKKLISDISGLSTTKMESVHLILERADLGKRGRRKTVAMVVIAVLILVVVGVTIFARLTSAELESTRTDRDNLQRDNDVLQVERGSLRTELIETQKELQGKLNEGHAIFAYVDGSADWAEAIAREHDALRSLAEHLKDVSARFENSFGEGDIPAGDTRLIRLARATAANAEGRFSEADALITDADIEQSTTEHSRLLLAKADATYGLGQWEISLSYYERANSVQRSNETRTGMANSLYYLGRNEEAEKLWLEILSQIGEEFNHGDREKAREAAIGMANYSGVLLKQWKLEEAFRYAMSALSVFSLLRASEKDAHTQGALDLDVARTLVRVAHILQAFEEDVVAERYLLAALTIYRTPTVVRCPPEYIAVVLDDLGMIYLEHNRMDDAVKALTGACFCYETGVKSGSVGLTHDWSVSLYHLATAHTNANPHEAFEAISKAIQLMEPLATNGATKDELAISFVQRGTVRLRLDDVDAAEDDFDRAATLASASRKAEINAEIQKRKDDALTNE